MVVEVPQELKDAVLRACEAAAKPLPEEMTTNQAAKFFGASRSFVIKLVRQRELSCRMVGKHRRIPTPSLLAYKEASLRQAEAACAEMARLSQETGLDTLEKTAESK
jgi:excisionase family DNA binding protein